MTKRLPTPLALSASIAATHPNPPPAIVPIPRFNPLLSVAPGNNILNYGHLETMRYFLKQQLE